MPEEEKAIMKPMLVRLVSVIVLACMLILVANTVREEQVSKRISSAPSLSRLLMSFASTGTGIVEVRGLTNAITVASDEACSILGYGPGELNGLPINMILPIDFRSTHTLSLQRAMSDVILDKSKSHVSIMRCLAVTKGGEKIEVVVRVHISREGMFALINKFDSVQYRVMPGIPTEPIKQ